MKLKPAILIYFNCLLAAALVFSFSGVVLGQQKATSKSQTAKRPAKLEKKDADYWFNKGDGSDVNYGSGSGRNIESDFAVAEQAGLQW